MIKIIILIMFQILNPAFAESRQIKPVTFFLTKESYLYDFKNRYEMLYKVCIGKVVIRSENIKYFVCKKFFEKNKIYSSYSLDSTLKILGIEEDYHPIGSYLIKNDRLRSEKKLKNGGMYLVFTENRRDFFIEIKDAKKFLDILADKNFPDVHPNPAHQVCFEESDCVSVEKSCTERVGINKKFLKKYTESMTNKILENCKTDEKKNNKNQVTKCFENFCTLE